jgi:DNA-binding LytR/AlgR family response regulator
MKEKEMRKLSIRMEESHRIIDEDDLVYAMVEKGTVTAVTKDSSGELSCSSLDDLQSMLPKERFLRVHRSYVVNINMIQEVIPWFNGTYRLKLKNNSIVPLSRNRVKKLRSILRF